MILSYACAQLWSKDKGICERLGWFCSWLLPRQAATASLFTREGQGVHWEHLRERDRTASLLPARPRPPGRWRMNDECVELVSWQGHPRPRLGDPCITPGKGFWSSQMGSSAAQSRLRLQLGQLSAKNRACLSAVQAAIGGSRSGNLREKGVWS